MLKPIQKKFKGLITVSGPTKSGKSKLAEYLIKDQDSITYIATSKPRIDDPEWQGRINIHRQRRPDSWKLIDYPRDIITTIESKKIDEAFLLDSLGGVVEQHIMFNNEDWELFQSNFINCLIKNDFGIIVVTEEVGWGVVPATAIGHLFRERLSSLSLLLSQNSKQKWLAVNGTAIDLDNIGYLIP
tara:strand:- start:846 stop:1403 length:558 start_codon:yes stop_codon:yes gene_type:complete